MDNYGTKHTNKKGLLSNIAEVICGVYIKPSPKGEIAYLQVKDLLTSSPEKTAFKIDMPHRQHNNLLQKGDLLFAGKGTTYLCRVFDLDIPAVASTTLYAIRLHSNAVSPQYLCWYLNHPKVVAQVTASRVGSGTPLIHKSTIENVEIIIPDKDTQQRIVELAKLQKKEENILKTIAEKRVILTNQILMNKISK